LNGIPNNKVYGVPGGQKNELEPLPGWLELTSEIDRVQREWETSNDAAKEITYYKVYEENRRMGSLSDYLKEHNITDQGAIQIFLLRSPLDTTSKLEYHIKIANTGMKNLYNKSLATKINNEFEVVNNKYPMLKHMGLRTDEVDDIKEYVQLVSKS
jgi:hypothetical protein